MPLLILWHTTDTTNARRQGASLFLPRPSVPVAVCPRLSWNPLLQLIDSVAWDV